LKKYKIYNSSVVANLFFHLSQGEKTILARYRKPPKLSKENINPMSLDYIGEMTRSIIEFETSPFGNLDKLSLEHCFTHHDEEKIHDLITKGEKFPLVLGYYPFGLRGTNKNQEIDIEEIDKATHLISNKGIGVFITQSKLSFLEQNKLTDLLSKNKKFISGIIALPEKHLKPFTSLKAVLLVISTEKRDKIFLAELSEFSDAKFIAQNYLNRNSSQDLNDGKWVDIKECSYGLESYKTDQIILKLSKDSDYSDYRKYRLDEIAKDFILTKKKFDEKKSNTFYVPLIGSRECTTQLDSKSMKHQNYCQILIENNIVSAAYIAEYLNSRVGKLQLMNIVTGSIIPRRNIAKLKKITVPVPSLKLQENIVNYKIKLVALAETIDRIKENISLNPITSEEDLLQIDKMMEVIGRLNQADTIRNIIIKGESKTLEFKETFQVPVKNIDGKKIYDDKQEWIETQVFKTITAFLNSEGGDLLIGVSDDLEIIGIDFEIDKYQKSNDNFLQYFRNKLKKRIGEVSYQFINYDLIKIDGKKILHVTSKPSTKETLLDDKDFYVRTNPASDKLEGQKMLEYIKNRFY